MHGVRKRKLSRRAPSSVKSAKASVSRGAEPPFRDHPRPTPEECLSVRDDLLSLHGFPQEFVKYRNQRMQSKTLPGNRGESKLSTASDEGIDGGESVLDGLVRTILSQNTTELNSEKAFASLRNTFPTWEDVLAADSKCIEDAIRCGGLAPTKSSCIKNLLRWLLDRKGKLCMEYLRELSVDEVKAELSFVKGIGPKTVSCVLMFQLQHDDFPVDTHVFQIAKTIGWVPAIADIKKTYLHLNQRIPAHLKFDLNCLLYTHEVRIRGASISVTEASCQLRLKDSAPGTTMTYEDDYCMRKNLESLRDTAMPSPDISKGPLTRLRSTRGLQRQ